MSMTPYATDTKFTHENSIATCPVCDHKNTFNRVTDLRDERPIDCKLVHCHECKQEFFINGDSVNPIYEKLFFEACDSYREKQYRECIATLMTSLENLLLAALRKLLVEGPFANEHDPNWEKLERLQEQLGHRVERWAFPSLRNALINAVTHGLPATTSEAARTIRTLSPQLDAPALARQENPRLADLFEKLRSLTLTDLRNRVLHKQAYRPTHEEAAAAIAETEAVLYGIIVRFRLDNDDFFRTLYGKTATAESR